MELISEVSWALDLNLEKIVFALRSILFRFIRSHLCKYCDSWAVVACAKSWHDPMIIFVLEQHGFESWAHEAFMKWSLWTSTPMWAICYQIVKCHLTHWIRRNIKYIFAFSILLPDTEMGHAVLTHWGRVTHICVRKLTTIGSDND